MASKMAIFVYFALVMLLALVTSSNAQSTSQKMKEATKKLNGIRLELVKQLQVCARDKVAAEVFQLSGYIFSRCLFEETVLHGYDARTYRHLGDTRWNIPGDSAITDLFVNPLTKSLFIRVNSTSGSSGTDTWRITLSDHRATLYNTINYPHSMYSISAKDHALTVHQNARGARRLSVFGADGREVHRVNLPGEKEFSLIEETQAETFLLGQRYTDDDPYAFKEMNKYGKILQSYQLYTRRYSDKIYYPNQVVTDKFGNLFISDVINPTLYVTDKDMTMSKQLLTDTKSSRGFTSLAYDPEADRLLVVTASNPRHVVDIYSITYDQ